MALFNGGWKKEKQESENQDVKMKIQALEESIESCQKKISDLDKGVTGFSKEEIEFYRKQELKRLEEFEVRKFNLMYGFDEFAFLDDSSENVSSNDEKKDETVNADTERKIKWLNECIENTKKRLNEIDKRFTGLSEEEINFYKRQELKLLEEFEVRKFNLMYGFDEFAFLDDSENNSKKK